MSDYVPKGFVHVDDLRLQLTLDIRLQRAARHSLIQHLQKFNAGERDRDGCGMVPYSLWFRILPMTPMSTISRM